MLAKKTLFYSSLFAITSALSANYDEAQIKNLEDRVSALENKKGPRIINPAARPQVKDGYDLFFTADFLWWKATETGLAYAIRTTNADGFINDGVAVTSTPHHKIKNPHFHWKPGFRVGAGYNLPHDGWDLFLNWTWYYDHTKNHVDAPSGGAIFPTWILPSDTAAADATYEKAHALWRLHLNVVDLELGRQFWVSKWLSLRPHGGLRTAWVRQNYHIEYEDSAVIDEYETKMKNNFWGLGIRTGLNGEWGFGSGWSIYTDAAISLIYGHFTIRQKDASTSPTDIETELFTAKDRFSEARAITDLAIGVRWDRLFCNDRFHIRFQAGWENHIFFEQNQFMHFAESVEPGLFFSNQGDLTLNGLAVSTRFDF